MASWIRRLQRQVLPSQTVHPEIDSEGRPKVDRHGRPILYANAPREVFFMGRGNKLGVFNPKGADYLARKAREDRRKASA